MLSHAFVGMSVHKKIYFTKYRLSFFPSTNDITVLRFQELLGERSVDSQNLILHGLFLSVRFNSKLGYICTM